MIQMNLSMKQIDSDMSVDLCLPREGMVEDGLGPWGWQIKTITSRLVQQKDPTI